MDLIAALEKLITEHASAAVLRDHLALLRDQLKPIMEENVKLKNRVTSLEDIVRKLTGELQAKARSDDFVEHEGALFKRKAAGGYDKVVYCPECKRSTSSLGDELPFHCARCRWSAAFNGHQLLKVMATLP